ncbi:hypothetical protein HPG69_009663 [Diceros bicornis minor]|uniref:NEDD4 family-interacting protein 2 n=1 Tax=Diceros bicornis minor TaxID=77932 RepID=A0A7J7EXH7_DICBM|nr:hypothetical protein HPG69_009663 [Diceros bicornis minor]
MWCPPGKVGFQLNVEKSFCKVTEVISSFPTIHNSFGSFRVVTTYAQVEAEKKRKEMRRKMKKRPYYWLTHQALVQALFTEQHFTALPYILILLHNEEDNSESPAVEQPSTSNPTPQVVQAAPSASILETDSSPPPYSSITVEVPTTSDTEVYSEFYPVPPPYSVATSLPTYDEAEKAKAAAMAAAAAETSQRIQEEECPPRDDFSDADQLRVGNDGIFMLAFFMAFIFNWLGFCLSFCITNTIAGRYGAICGFGLSLIKWILIVRFSDYFTGYFNGQYWLWWIFLVLGLLLFFRGFVNYLKVRNMSENIFENFLTLLLKDTSKTIQGHFSISEKIKFIMLYNFFCISLYFLIYFIVFEMKLSASSFEPRRILAELKKENVKKSYRNKYIFAVQFPDSEIDCSLNSV